MPTRPSYFTPKHRPARAENRPNAYQRGYDQTHWGKLRDAHLQAHPFCVYCDRFATCVDHRVPITVDPSRRLDPSNLRSCCDSCHSLVTNAYKATGVNEMPAHTQAIVRERSGLRGDPVDVSAHVEGQGR
jgi:5-methylcytosine-specific restriction enzyme A